MLSLALATHLGSLGINVQKCAFSLVQLHDRYSLTKPGSPEAKAVAETMLGVYKQCRLINEDFEQASLSYQTTVLALLGGAGLSTGLAVATPKRVRASDNPK
jgi:hypothetical protein